LYKVSAELVKTGEWLGEIAF